MDKKFDENTIFTSANIVTIIRILFVPVFVVALISPWPSWIDNSGNLDFIKPWVALFLFIVLSLTDSVDGYLARSKNQITNFGKFMDPLADKILVFAALIALVELHILPSWVVLIILMREFIVAGIRMLAASKGEVIAASWYGKAKTVTQLIAIILFILKESLSSVGAQNIASPLYIVAWVVMIIALILTVVSMIDYIYNARFVFNSSESVDDKIMSLSSSIINLSKNNNIKICCAESLTGGLLSSSLIKVPGASSVFTGGIVSYMYSIKEKLLNVSHKSLDENGAVNEYTAKTMAENALKNMNTDFALSTTGIAGPDSDEFNTPVGTVFIGLANKNDVKVYQFQFDGSREEIRNLAVLNALVKLNEAIKL